MAGKPFKVGRFAHTLRVRLMREHIGVDVDALSEADLMASAPVKPEHEQETWDPDAEQEHGREDGVTQATKSKSKTPSGAMLKMFTDGVQQGKFDLMYIADHVINSFSCTWNRRCWLWYGGKNP